MKYKLLLGASFGAVLVGSLVAHVPVSWLWQQAPKVQGLEVSGLSGTPWQGAASQVRWQGMNLGRLQWDMRVLSLFTGKVKLDVRFGQGSEMNLAGRGMVGYQSAGPFAENLLVSLPASQIVNYAPMTVPVSLAGNLELTLRNYQFASPYCAELDGALAWTSGQVNSPLGALNPGPVIADLACEDGKVLANVEQASADVSSEWAATLSPGNRYALVGWFKPGAEFPAQLSQQLKWLGNPDPKGQYKIDYNGRF
ncbi:type II secretion system protein N [Photobacterium sanctipauli]|uniref:Type II secretion system protein N n=1 Tax=Photobacterium sanctipauli TaxID=1342794 RepID=A0A2T3NEX6_9GAMM|nr:type II secretion system protein N [Photobacterium sanctipauli]PSW13126.1 type II secretion system protein N [Photobacterium sanctipauli]